jgi:parallel beta-helix repeat protein
MKTHLTVFIAVCVMLFAFTAPAATFYVDVNTTNPVPPYADLTTAAAAIPDAVDAATNGDLILVNDGVYQDEFRTNAELAGLTQQKIWVTNRVMLAKAVTVQSLNGPSAAFINGSGIYRCVYVTNGATLNGFTLMNGAAGWISTTTYLGRNITTTNLCYGGGVTGSSGPIYFRGGVVTNCVLVGNTATAGGGGAYLVTLINCILTNNSATSGGGAYDSTLINCIVTGNSAATSGVIYNGPLAPSLPVGAGGGICSGAAINCLFVGNTAFQGGGVWSAANLAGCTVVNNSASFYGGIGQIASSLPSRPYLYNLATNCIVYFNSAATNDNWGGTNLTFDHCCTLPLPAGGLGNFTNDPAFVDYAGGDFHLQSNSLCINSGRNSAVTTSTDLDGDPRIVAGTVDIGAYEYQTPASVISYAWLQQYGFPTDGSADYADYDGTGMNNWQKWIAGLNPTNALSVFKMTSAVPETYQNWVIVKWQSVDTRTYFLQRSTNLASPAGFSTIQSNIVGMSGTTISMDNTATNGGPYFYRVGVQQ